MGLIAAGIYYLLAWIDTIVYTGVAASFRVIFDIAHTEFFTSEQINSIANRVYIILGVLMLFKVVIAAIQYLINPDTFDDKEKGFGGILKKTILTVVMIVIVPAIFEFAINIQGSIMKALPSIILGSEASSSLDNDKIGRDIAFTALSSFVNPIAGKGGSVGPNGEIHDFQSFRIHVLDGMAGITLAGAKYDYMILVSTAAGIFMAYVLISMTIDIAIRTIKLGIIRILAPIPISSYILGKDKLNKFVKTSIQVYLDLFIRLGVVYFVILMVQLLINNGTISVWNGIGLVTGITPTGAADTGSWVRNALVNHALIDGLFVFAKKAPKFISDLLGLPDIGSGELADMFKPIWKRSPTMAIQSGIVGAAGANFLNIAMRGAQGKTFGEKLKNTLLNKNTWKNKDAWKSAAAGAASAGSRGFLAAAQGKNNADIIKAGYTTAIKKRQNREMEALMPENIRPTFARRMEARFTDQMGLATDASLASDQIKAQEAATKAIGNAKSLGRTTLEKQGADIDVNVRIDDSTGAVVAGNTQLQKVGAQLQRYINETNSTDPSLQALADRINNGGHVSYDDIVSLRKISEKSENLVMGNIATMLSDSNDVMRKIQKTQYKLMQQQKVHRMDGTYNDDVNNDRDLRNQFNAMEQTIVENAANLVGVAGSTNVTQLLDNYRSDFTSFGDAVTDANTKAREVLATDYLASARESNRRREENNKSGS